MMTPSTWTAMYSELPLNEAMTALHRCGWDTFEVSIEHLKHIEESKQPDALIATANQTAKDQDFNMRQAHPHLRANVAAFDADGRKADIECIERHMDIAAQLGVTVVVIHPGGRQGYTTRDERQRILDLNIEAFRRLGDRAGEHGMRIALENLMRPGMSMSADLLELIRTIDHPTLGVVLDTSHANVVGMDVPKAIREFNAQLIATHFSDNDGSGDQHRMPGNGTIDWPPIMEALRDIGYNGTINLEIGGERHPQPDIKRMKATFACTMTKWLIDSVAS